MTCWWWTVTPGRTLPGSRSVATRRVRAGPRSSWLGVKGPFRARPRYLPLPRAGLGGTCRSDADEAWRRTHAVVHDDSVGTATRRSRADPAAADRRTPRRPPRRRPVPLAQHDRPGYAAPAGSAKTGGSRPRGYAIRRREPAPPPGSTEPPWRPSSRRSVARWGILLGVRGVDVEAVPRREPANPTGQGPQGQQQPPPRTRTTIGDHARVTPGALDSSPAFSRSDARRIGRVHGPRAWRLVPSRPAAPEVVHDGLQPQHVPVRPQAHDARHGDVVEEVDVPERLPRGRVREVDLDERPRDAQQRVAQGDARVRQAARVDDARRRSRARGAGR